MVESGNKEKVTVALQSAEVSNKKEKRERLTEWQFGERAICLV